ncbi:MAG: flagellar biosynthesis repressor FlbT [Puniceicoccaceae bacterium]
MLNITHNTPTTVALKITLKPNEKIYINGALLSNGDHASQLFIENKVRLLREKEIMTPERAKSVAQQVYLTIQMMYFEPERVKIFHKTYWQLVRVLTEAAPSMTPMIHEISEKILVEEYYSALKLTKKLIDYEKQLMDHAKKSN